MFFVSFLGASWAHIYEKRDPPQCWTSNKSTRKLTPRHGSAMASSKCHKEEDPIRFKSDSLCSRFLFFTLLQPPPTNTPTWYQTNPKGSGKSLQLSPKATSPKHYFFIMFQLFSEQFLRILGIPWSIIVCTFVKQMKGFLKDYFGSDFGGRAGGGGMTRPL